MNDTLKFYINFLTNKYNKTQLNRKELCQELDISLSAYAGTIRTASRFTSGHSAGVDR